MIKAIIFDFGGVILKHKATLVRDILTQILPQSPDQAVEIWKKYQPAVNRGKKTSLEFLIELKKNLHSEFSIDELQNKWRELYKKEAIDVDRELLNLIGKLKKKYKIYMFTDTIDIHDAFNKTRHIYDKFDKVYKSYEEGIAKSDGKAAYQYLLKKINLNPDECIFVDDLEYNVKTAQDAGIKGIVYKSLPQLKNELSTIGITV